MRNIFDYTYYRTAKRHFKNDGIDAFTARLTFTFILSLYSIPFLVIISDLIKIDSNIPKHIILYTIIFIVIQYFLKKYYNGKYLIFREKWAIESKIEKWIGILYIVFFFFSPVAFLFLYQKIKYL